MDGWTPKLNSHLQVVSGSGSIWLRNSYLDTVGLHIGDGWTPAFLNDDTIIYNNGTNVSEYFIPSKQTKFRSETYSLIVAAQNRYIGWLQGAITVDGEVINDVSDDISISKSGKNVAWIAPWQSESKNIIINRKKFLSFGSPYTAPIMKMGVGDKGIVWSEITEGGKRIVKGNLASQFSIDDLTVRGWEEALILDTSDLPYVVSTFQDGIGVRPYGSAFGWFRLGTFFIGDCIFSNSKVIVVGSDDHGQPLYWEPDLNSNTVDFRTLDDMANDTTQAQIDELATRVGNLERQVGSLNSQVSSLNNRVTNLEHSSSSGTPVESRVVAIKSARGKYLRDDWDDSLGHFDRDTAGEGEHYTLESVNGGSNFPNPPISAPLAIGGKFFTRGGQIVRVKRFTSFKLLNLFEKKNNINPILSDYEGYNSARIFTYTPQKDWGSESWEFPDKIATLEFLHAMLEKGLDVELTLITDNDPVRVSQSKDLIEYLSVNPVPNLILEAVNEPFIHDKIDPNELKNALNNSPYLYSSGIYTDNRKFFGKFWNDHSPRDSQWYRKGGHNLMEAYNGGGPNFPDEPALRMPGVEDEPIKPNEMGFNSVDLYAYSASCGLMGAGATFHSESGKFSRRLSSEEMKCKEEFLKGLNIYPLDAANGTDSYRRIDETEEGRTYVVGNYAIRIHQLGYEFPEPGWTPLDSIGVCWKRS